MTLKCGNCERLKAINNGLKELADSQAAFIREIKRKFAKYSGEEEHWKKIRERRGKGAKSS